MTVLQDGEGANIKRLEAKNAQVLRNAKTNQWAWIHGECWYFTAYTIEEFVNQSKSKSIDKN